MTNQQSALVTGISSGLGQGIAEALLDRGYRLFGASRRGAGSLGDRVDLHAAEFDLTDFDRVPECLARLLAAVKHFDLVVLNAGFLGEMADLGDTPLADLQRLMAVNLWANKVVLDALFALGLQVDQVVAISSGASVSGSRGWNGYALSKAALNMLMKLYAGERATTHFCALAPGLIDTAMQDYLCALDQETQFPTLARIKAARGTAAMPSPREAGEKVADVLARLRALPSGAYVDIREL